MVFRNGSHQHIFEKVYGFDKGHSARLTLSVRGSHVLITSVDRLPGSPVKNGDDPWMWSANIKMKRHRSDSKSIEVKTLNVKLSRMEIKGRAVTGRPAGESIGTDFFDERLSPGDLAEIREALNDVSSRENFYAGFTPAQQEKIYHAFRVMHAQPPRPAHIGAPIRGRGGVGLV
jgi:hypothetical protein